MFCKRRPPGSRLLLSVTALVHRARQVSTFVFTLPFHQWSWPPAQKPNTVHFLREFIDDAQLAAAKGKEREVCDQEQENESFLPWYVYDAMKENKRFESMRVHAPTCPTSSQSYSRSSPRVVNKKTQKSSSGSISTPSRKNCFTSKIH